MYGCIPHPGGRTRYCVDALRTRFDSIDAVKRFSLIFLHIEFYRTSVDVSVNSIEEYAAIVASE